MTVVRKGVPTAPLTASTLVQSGQGVLLSIICSASGTGLISIYDSATAATNNNTVSSFPLTAGTIYTFDIAYNNGLYIVLVSGSATFTAVYS